MTPSPWLVTWGHAVAGRPALLCLPQAGAGCGQFRTWRDRLAPEVAVLGVQLPGREERWPDPPAGDVGEVVDAVVAALLGQCDPHAPLAIFGHSFGGLLGYEIAHRLVREHGWCLRALVVTACRPPRAWAGAGRGLVDDGAGLERLLADRGLGDELDEDTRELVLEVLRHDARLSSSYRHVHEHPLAAPIHAWGGDADATVTAAQLDGWVAYTSGAFERRQFPGDHYFFAQHLDTVLDLLGRLVHDPEPVRRQESL